MRILIVCDKEGTAIWRLAQSVKRGLPHHQIVVLPVHPKKGDFETLSDAQKLMKWADVIDIHYWKSGQLLRETFPVEFSAKPNVLFHFNPYDLETPENANYKVLVVGNKEMQNKIPSARLVPYGVDLSFFKFNENYIQEKRVMMSVNRIEGKKGVREVAQVCKELGYRFTLVGRVSKPEYMQQVVETSGGILEFFEGVSDDFLLKAYYNSAIHVCNSIDGYESGCYDDKTEILTNVGWKLFKDLDKTELVATLNPKSNQLEFKKPDKYIEQDNHKELVSIETNSISMRVTKNHNVWVGRITTLKGKPIALPFKFYQADKLPEYFEIQKICSWQGETKKSLDWFRFMAIYLSEGSVENGSKNSYRIQLAVTKKDIKNKVRNLLDRMGFSYTEQFDRFRIGKQNELGKYLVQFGKSNEKFIPNEVLNAPKKYIKEFLEWFIYGDGNIHKNNKTRTYYSSSKRIVDGLQECLLKVSRSGHIKILDNVGKKRVILGHKPVNTNYKSFILYERSRRKNAVILKEKLVKTIPYDGKVFCVEVKNHILLVRRKGIPFFCGNTLPILEAMATGVPVLTRMIGMVPDLYNGDNMQVRKGLPEDVEDLKTELKTMMENRAWREKLRQKAWDTVRTRDDRRMALDIQHIYYTLHKPQIPLISIIIPTRDHPASFSDCLVGAVQQDFPKFEIVVADSGTVPVRLIVEEMRKHTEIPIKYMYFQNKGNYTLAEARNRAGIEADGSILVFCDDRLKMAKNVLSVFATYHRPNVWLWGMKDKTMKGFVENFSCVSRYDLIRCGMFNERMQWYGGMTQEVRERFEGRNGLNFIYMAEAEAESTRRSSSRVSRREDIIEAKFLIYKLYHK